MELRDYLHVLRKYAVLIVITTLVGVGAAAVWSLTRTPLYNASSTVYVSTQSSDSVAELQQGQTFTQSRVATYAALATTPVVIDPIITELGLDTTADSQAARVKATVETGTNLITITVTDPDPAQAAEISNAIAGSLTETVESLDTLEGQETSPVRLTRVENALPPSQAASPNVPINLVLGLLLGLAAGIGIAMLLTVLDTKVRTKRDVEHITETAVLGAIPFDAKWKQRPLIINVDPLSPRAEAFRSLRTNLQFVDFDGKHSFTVTSSMPSEGKSSTAINLAIALADAGKKVALLDADLRKPKVADYCGIDGAVGLSDVLIGNVRLGDVMLPWGQRSLYVLAAGRIPPNPSELLGSPQMSQLLAALERDFDVVICDSPPLLPVTDAAVLSRATSRVITVVAAGETTKQQLAAAMSALENVDAKQAGIVITKVPTRGADAATYGYGYGYGEQRYGDEPDEEPRRRRRSANVEGRA
ncbi:polysaccharide biosynthesis tyrosine autokinase [Microbacterium sp. NPDC058345]|uniref:polysaccharide biosynthesis tyrosine autokinase n=1 Tax=Microbacterium sp. NPDC058345 TaxID=3346455 RepID=UPI00364CB941